MPRNSSGTYTLPAGNPVAPNTLIETNWANPTMSDIGSALTDSLDRFGRGSMLAPIKGVDGAPAGPMYAFSAAATTGMYRTAAGALAFSVLGLGALSISSTVITALKPVTFNEAVTFDGAVGFTGVVSLANGTALLPSLAFTSDPDLGIYRVGADVLGFTTAGASRFQIGAAQLLAQLPLMLPDGTEAAPALGASTDPNTGLWFDPGNSGTMRFSSQGVNRVTFTPSQVSYTVPIRAADGDATAPGVSFAADTDTGIFRGGANLLSFASNGAESFRVASVVTAFVQMRLADGTAAAPGLAFTSDTDLGLYRIGSNVMGVGGNGAESFRFDAGANAFYIGEFGTGIYSRFTTNQWLQATAATATMYLTPQPADGTSNASVNLFRFTNTTGSVTLSIYKGDNTTSVDHQFVGGITGLAAQISRGAGTRTTIGGGADDGVSLLQVNGRTTITMPAGGIGVSIINAAGSGITANTNYDDLVLHSAGNGGMTLATSGASTLGIMFATSDTATDGRIQYAQTTRAMTLYAANSQICSLDTDGLNMVASRGINLSASGTLTIGGLITRFVSAEQATSSATVTRTVAHGGSRVPDLFYWVLRCKVAEFGYAVNDEIIVNPNDVASSSRQYSMHANATNIVLIFVTSGGAAPIIRENTGANGVQNITLANWRWVAKAHWL